MCSSRPPNLVNLSSTTWTSSIYQELQAYRHQRATDLKQLGQDLQAANLTAAQTDFNTLTALGESGPNKNGQTFQRADREQDFQAIGQALQSGHLADAQSAYASLAGTFGGQNHQAKTAISAYNSDPAEIVINIGAPSTATAGGVPSLILSSVSTTPRTQPTTITSTGASTGSETRELGISTDPLTINLNPQANYELIPNPLNANTAIQTTNNSGTVLSAQA